MSLSCWAQTGINTSSPRATLDVTGSATNASVLDGVVLPSVTGNTLTGTTYTSSQTGDMVYVTARPTSPNSQTRYIRAAGPAYFDGTAWRGAAVNFSGTVLNFGDIGGPAQASFSVNGQLLSASSLSFYGSFNDVTVVHNLNLSNYFVAVTFQSMSTGNNYIQLDLDNEMEYSPVLHDVGPNSFSLFLENYSGVQQLRFVFDIVTQ